MNGRNEAERPNRPAAGRDDWSNHWSRYATLARENPAQAMRHALIIDELARMPPMELLVDIGSGQGDFLDRATSQGLARTYVGFEISESGVAISRGKVPGAQFHQLDVLKPSTLARGYEGTADAAVCSDVIEHVDDPAQFLREAARFIKPGGAIVVTVPGGPMSAFDRHIGHRQHFSRASLRRVLEAAGLSVERVSGAGFPFFNLYRMSVILRGKRLVEDVDAGEFRDETQGRLARAVIQAFGFLFRFNVHGVPLGWQMVAVGRRRN